MKAGGGKRNPNISPITITVGSIFGELTIISRGPNAKHGHFRWWCICTCGFRSLIWATSLRSGASTRCRSCGVRANTIHGWAGTPTYKAWENMHSRCTLNIDSQYYDAYAKRGIAVCNRWRKFKNFLDDMGVKPKGLSLDRQNNDKGYSKQNCHWATARQQANNSRHNYRITYKDQTKTLAQWARHFGLDRNTTVKKLGVPKYGTLLEN